ncbi:MAG: hypothetical protein ACREP1_06605 [Rhodanobacteraceae bacterium]
MHRRLLPFVIGAIFLCGAAAASARPVVTLHLTGTLVQQRDGRTTERSVEGLVLKAGDLVRYTIAATNSGDLAARKLVPVGPIPKATSFVPGSARGDDATPQFTLDGKTWSAKPMLVVKTANGSVRKPADPALYRAVRWIARGTLAPRKREVFSYDVRVNGHSIK